MGVREASGVGGGVRDHEAEPCRARRLPLNKVYSRFRPYFRPTSSREAPRTSPGDISSSLVTKLSCCLCLLPPLTAGPIEDGALCLGHTVSSLNTQWVLSMVMGAQHGDGRSA